jgi:hypothetical protein
MPKSDDNSVSPYLRRPLRPFEEAQREQTQGEKRPHRRKAPTKAVTRDPVDKASPDDPNDR